MAVVGIGIEHLSVPALVGNMDLCVEPGTDCYR